MTRGRRLHACPLSYKNFVIKGSGGCNISDKMLKELMATFQAELQEHLSTLNKGLITDPQTIACECGMMSIPMFFVGQIPATKVLLSKKL